MDKIAEAAQRLTLTVPEAGVILGIGRAAAYDAAARGEIPTIKIGRLLRVPRRALERMLDARTSAETGASDRALTPS